VLEGVRTTLRSTPTFLTRPRPVLAESNAKCDQRKRITAIYWGQVVRGSF
jgi:hypothetical protein